MNGERSRDVFAATAIAAFVAAVVFLFESAHARNVASALSVLRPRDAALLRIASCGLLVLATVVLTAALIAPLPRGLRARAIWWMPTLLLGHLLFTLAPEIRPPFTTLATVGIALAGGMATWKLDPRRISPRISIALLATISLGAVGVLGWGSINPGKRHPHILLLGVDGLSATHLSAYGAARPTTPFLASQRAQAWFMERAFSNACCTLGSTVSVLTGNLPMRSHVAYPPQHLDGKDAFRHLPGLLRSVGYETHEVVKLYYSDGDSAGLREAFDTINGEREERPLWPWPGRFALIVRATYSRLFGHPLVVPHPPRTSQAPDLSDIDNLERVYGLLTSADRPTFVHAHLMATHGPVFPVVVPVFSAGQAQTGWWMDAFYDDVIRETDERIGTLMARLEQAGVLDDTLVIFYSDHGHQWTTTDRVPLVVRLPKSVTELPRSGARADNVALIDIAPTILRLLGVERPGWMRDGRSLFDPPATDRLIFAVSAMEGTAMEPDGVWRIRAPGPPRYGMSLFSVIDGASAVQVEAGAKPPQLVGIDGAKVGADRGGIVDKAVERLALLLEGMGQPVLAADVRDPGSSRPR